MIIINTKKRVSLEDIFKLRISTRIITILLTLLSLHLYLDILYECAYSTCNILNINPFSVSLGFVAIIFSKIFGAFIFESVFLVALLFIINLIYLYSISCLIVFLFKKMYCMITGKK